MADMEDYSGPPNPAVQRADSSTVVMNHWFTLVP